MDQYGKIHTKFIKKIPDDLIDTIQNIYDLINTEEIQSQYISSIQEKSEAVFYQINILCYLCQLPDQLKNHFQTYVYENF